MQDIQVQTAILNLYPDLLAWNDPASGQPADFLVVDNELVEWNTVKYPEPTEEDLARGDLEAAKKEKVAEFFVGALGDFVEMFPEVEGSYGAVPRELLDQAFMAHFFFSLEASSNPEKAQAVGALLAKFRSTRTELESKTIETTSAEDIRSERWEDA